MKKRGKSEVGKRRTASRLYAKTDAREKFNASGVPYQTPKPAKREQTKPRLGAGEYTAKVGGEQPFICGRCAHVEF